MTLIITDGNDEHSVHSNARDVAAIARDMLKAETHIIAAMGIDDGHTDFKEVFREMGIRDEWILIPGQYSFGNPQGLPGVQPNGDSRQPKYRGI